jgi:hypothetical protein
MTLAAAVDSATGVIDHAVADHIDAAGGSLICVLLDNHSAIARARLPASSSPSRAASRSAHQPGGRSVRHDRFIQRVIAKVLPILGPSAEGLYGQRMAEKKSLGEIAAVKSDELELFVGFDAFADDANAQAMRHGDDRLDHRCVPWVVRDVEDK